MSSKIILALFISALIFTFGIQPISMALDDLSSLQCDDGIVAPGDSEDSVKEKCGETQQVLKPYPHFSTIGKEIKRYHAVISGLFCQHTYAGGFYLPEVGSPGSVGTAGVANVVNNFGTDSALT